MDLIPDITTLYNAGLLTTIEYLILSCERLEVDLATVDRGWLADQCGIPRSTVYGAIKRHRALQRMAETRSQSQS
jgi:hypothetical protein